MRALNRQRDALGHPAPVHPLAISLPELDPPAISYLDGFPKSKVMDWELGADADVITNKAAIFRSRDGGQFAKLTRPTEAQFAAQLDLISVAGDQRADRYDEIEVQLLDQLSFFGSTAFIHPSRTPLTVEFLDAALRLCVMVEFRIKHAFSCPRPVIYSPDIQPIIQTPTHGCLPSGHATEAFMTATLLREMFGAVFPGAVKASNDADPFCKTVDDIAARIAINRTVAGVHFPMDSAAGSVLGRRIAQYIVARVGLVPQTKTLDEFKPADWLKDFDIELERENRAGASAPSLRVPPSIILAQCWNDCVHELHAAFPGLPELPAQPEA
jgi:hypothetical protein